MTEQEERRKVPRDEADQQLPTKNSNPIIQDMVIQDMQKRLSVGIQRYGTGLQAHNGRDMLKDLYDELMDACVYIKGVIYERDNPPSPVAIKIDESEYVSR